MVTIVKGTRQFERMPTIGASDQIVPSGGGTGQVLAKDSASDFDYSWQTIAGTGDVTAAANMVDNSIVRADGGAKGVQDSEVGTTTWTIADNGKLVGVGDNSGDYIMTIRNLNATSGDGFSVQAGEALGDLAFSIQDSDGTFIIMECEADQGYVTFGKSYAQTLTDNGTVYGVDNQNTGATAQDFNTDLGIYRIGGNPTMRGDRFQNASSDTESNTTLTSPQQKLRMTTPSLEVGLYRIGYSWEWRQSTTSNAFAGRVQINDTTTIAEQNETGEGDYSGNQWSAFSGFYYYSAGAGVANIDIDYNAVGGGTAYIRRARLEIWRVS